MKTGIGYREKPFRFSLRRHGHPFAPLRAGSARAKAWPRWPCHFKLNQRGLSLFLVILFALVLNPRCWPEEQASGAGFQVSGAGNQKSEIRNQKSPDALLLLHQANPYVKPELKLVALDQDSGAGNQKSEIRNQKSADTMIFLHRASPYAMPELKLVALNQKSQIANRQWPYSLFPIPYSLFADPSPQPPVPSPQAGPHNADQVLLKVYDTVNGALKANATLPGGSTNPTPHNGDQVLLASYDSVNGAVRINCVVGCSGNLPNIAILGSSATDEASLSSELTSATGWTTTGWTGSYSAGFTNGSGNTSALSYTISGMAAGQYYLVAATISGSTAGSLTLSLGGTTVNPAGDWNAPYWSGNGTWSAGVLTTGSGAFTITPTSTFNGTVGSISVKQVSPITTFNFVTLDSTGAQSFVGSQQLASLASLFLGVGPFSGNYNLGTQNVGLGNLALEYNISGYNNTAIGTGALRYNISGAQNTAVGQNALANNISGWYNHAFGQSVLMNNTTGYANVGIGEGALQGNTTGYFNVSVGTDSSKSITSGAYENTAIGWRAFGGATAGIGNVAVGDQTMSSNSGNYNVAVGHGALEQATTGGQNVAVGMNALLGASGATPSYDVAVGSAALGNVTTGINDTAMGANALSSLTTGTDDLCLGYDAGYLLTTGNDNVCLGDYAGYKNSTAYYNVAVGYSALYNDTSGSATAVGYQALYNLTGLGGVGVGYQAGKTETTGTYDTYVGFQADSASAGLTNATGLGYGAKPSTSNTMVFGNSSVTDAYFGSTSGAANLHGLQIQSTVATGTAPLVVASTTPVANLTASNHPQVSYCGTTSTCSNTAETSTRIVTGKIALASGSATISSLTAFTATATMFCRAQDETNAANLAGCVPASTTSITLSGTGSDTVSYTLVGW